MLLALPAGLVKEAEGGKRGSVEKDGLYQFVQVVEDDEGRRLLKLELGRAQPDDPKTVLTGGIWDSLPGAAEPARSTTVSTP